MYESDVKAEVNKLVLWLLCKVILLCLASCMLTRSIKQAPAEAVRHLVCTDIPQHHLICMGIWPGQSTHCRQSCCTIGATGKSDSCRKTLTKYAMGRKQQSLHALLCSWISASKLPMFAAAVIGALPVCNESLCLQ